MTEPLAPTASGLHTTTSVGKENEGMRVNVFITRQDGQLQNGLLVLPVSSDASIPQQYRLQWIYYATTDTSDSMFGNLDADTLEEEIARKGFAVVVPELPDRR
jgi:hypothetical protein